MNDAKQNETAPQGDATQIKKPGIIKGKAPITKDTLSPKMKGRYNSMFYLYKDKTIALLNHLTSRGRNSFDEFIVKSNNVNGSSGNTRNYYRSVTDAFVLDVDVSETDITNVICMLRSRFKLEPFKGLIGRQCVKEFYSLFVVKENRLTGTDGRTHPIYRPVFAVLAE